MANSNSLIGQSAISPRGCRVRLAALFMLAVLPTSGTFQTMHTIVHSSTPFAAGKLGASVYVGVNIHLRRAYRFALDVHIDPHDSAQLSKMGELMDGHPAADREPSDASTILIPIRLRVVRIEKNHVVSILDQVFAKEISANVDAGYVSMTITSLDLPPGDYRVRVEALQDNAVANALPIAFGLHPS